MNDRYQRPPRSSGPQRSERPTVYQRIMAAAAGGHGLTLTPDEVSELSALHEEAARYRAIRAAHCAGHSPSQGGERGNAEVRLQHPDGWGLDIAPRDTAAFDTAADDLRRPTNTAPQAPHP